MADTAAAPMGRFERFLTLWVALAMAGGVALGVLVPGLVQGIAAAEVASINLVVAVLIWAMVYPMMVGVDLGAVAGVRGVQVDLNQQTVTVDGDDEAALDRLIRGDAQTGKPAEGIVMGGDDGGVRSGILCGFGMAHGAVLSGCVETTRPKASFSFHTPYQPGQPRTSCGLFPLPRLRHGDEIVAGALRVRRMFEDRPLV